ncbi:hypothetical protein ACSRUE_45465 [Sorangium sp. KYC3313]
MAAIERFVAAIEPFLAAIERFVAAIEPFLAAIERFAGDASRPCARS